MRLSIKGFLGSTDRRGGVYGGVHSFIFSMEMDCPWDTIRMVPTPSAAGHQTSLDSQLNHKHVVFQNPGHCAGMSSPEKSPKRLLIIDDEDSLREIFHN